MDSWPGKSGQLSHSDGAFERFLTAAIATIITIMFSWRMLDKIGTEERREDEDEPGRHKLGHSSPVSLSSSFVSFASPYGNVASSPGRTQAIGASSEHYLTHNVIHRKYISSLSSRVVSESDMVLKPTGSRLPSELPLCGDDLERVHDLQTRSVKAEGEIEERADITATNRSKPEDSLDSQSGDVDGGGTKENHKSGVTDAYLDSSQEYMHSDLVDITDSSLEDVEFIGVDGNSDLFLNLSNDSSDNSNSKAEYRSIINNDNYKPVRVPDNTMDSVNHDHIIGAGSVDSYYNQSDLYDDDAQPRVLDSDEELFCCSMLEPIMEEDSDDLTASSECDSSSKSDRGLFGIKDREVEYDLEYEERKRGLIPGGNRNTFTQKPIHIANTSRLKPSTPSTAFHDSNRPVKTALSQKPVSHISSRIHDLEKPGTRLTVNSNQAARPDTVVNTGSGAGWLTCGAYSGDSVSYGPGNSECDALFLTDSYYDHVRQHGSSVDCLISNPDGFHRPTDYVCDISKVEHLGTTGEKEHGATVTVYSGVERAQSVPRFSISSFPEDISESDEPIQIVPTSENSSGLISGLRPNPIRTKRPVSDGLAYAPKRRKSQEEKEAFYRDRIVSEGGGVPFGQERAGYDIPTDDSNYDLRNSSYESDSSSLFSVGNRKKNIADKMETRGEYPPGSWDEANVRGNIQKDGEEDEETEYEEEVVETFVLPLSHERTILHTLQTVKNLLDQRSAQRRSDLIPGYEEDVTDSVSQNLQESESTCTATMIDVEGPDGMGFGHGTMGNDAVIRSDHFKGSDSILETESVTGSESTMGGFSDTMSVLARMDRDLKEKMGFRLNLDEYKTDEYTTESGWPIVRYIEKERVYISDNAPDDADFHNENTNYHNDNAYYINDDNTNGGMREVYQDEDMTDRAHDRKVDDNVAENEHYERGENVAVPEEEGIEWDEQKEGRVQEERTDEVQGVEYKIRSGYMERRVTPQDLREDTYSDAYPSWTSSPSADPRVSRKPPQLPLSDTPKITPGRPLVQRTPSEEHFAKLEYGDIMSPTLTIPQSPTVTLDKPEARFLPSSKVKDNTKTDGSTFTTSSLPTNFLMSLKDKSKYVSSDSLKRGQPGADFASFVSGIPPTSDQEYEEFVRDMSDTGDITGATLLTPGLGSGILSGNLATPYKKSDVFVFPKEETFESPKSPKSAPPLVPAAKDEEKERAEEKRNEKCSEEEKLEEDAVIKKPRLVRTSTAQDEEELLGLKSAVRRSSTGSLYDESVGILNRSFEETSSSSLALDRIDAEPNALSRSRSREGLSRSRSRETMLPESPVVEYRHFTETPRKYYSGMFIGEPALDVVLESSAAIEEPTAEISPSFASTKSFNDQTKESPKETPQPVVWTRVIPGSNFLEEKRSPPRERAPSLKKQPPDMVDSHKPTNPAPEVKSIEDEIDLEFADAESIPETKTTSSLPKSVTSPNEGTLKPIFSLQKPSVTLKQDLLKYPSSPEKPVFTPKSVFSLSKPTVSRKEDTEKPISGFAKPIIFTKEDTPKSVSSLPKLITSPKEDTPKPISSLPKPVTSPKEETPKPISNIPKPVTSPKGETPKPISNFTKPVTSPKEDTPKSISSLPQPITSPKEDTPKPITLPKDTPKPISSPPKPITSPKEETPKPISNLTKPITSPKEDTPKPISALPKPISSLPKPITSPKEETPKLVSSLSKPITSPKEEAPKASKVIQRPTSIPPKPPVTPKPRSSVSSSKNLNAPPSTSTDEKDIPESKELIPKPDSDRQHIASAPTNVKSVPVSSTLPKISSESTTVPTPAKPALAPKPRKLSLNRVPMETAPPVIREKISPTFCIDRSEMKIELVSPVLEKSAVTRKIEVQVQGKIDDEIDFRDGKTDIDVSRGRKEQELERESSDLESDENDNEDKEDEDGEESEDEEEDDEEMLDNSDKSEHLPITDNKVNENLNTYEDTQTVKNTFQVFSELPRSTSNLTSTLKSDSKLISQPPTAKTLQPKVDTSHDISNGISTQSLFKFETPTKPRSMKEVKKRSKQPYTSVLTQIPTTPTSPKAAPFILPENLMTPSRLKIIQSRNKFLSERNLLSDSYEDDFAARKEALLQSATAVKDRKYAPKITKNPNYRSQEQLEKIMYMINLKHGRSESSLHQSHADCLHDDCILTEKGRRDILDKALSIDSLHADLYRQLQRFDSETDMDGRSMGDAYFPETNSDLFDLTFPFQGDRGRNLDRPASMSELRHASDYTTISGSGPGLYDAPGSKGKGRFSQRQYKKSKSLCTLETNMDDVNFAASPTEDGLQRVPSAHELRISKSLQKLNVPNWYKQSNLSKSGSCLLKYGSSSSMSSWAFSPSLISSPCTTPSTTSNVVIKSRVQLPTSRNLRSPRFASKSAPTTPSFMNQPEEEKPPTPTPVKLPSDKMRTKDKPKALMPIPIVPFDKIRAMFEKKKEEVQAQRTQKEESPVISTSTSSHVSKTPPQRPSDLSPTKPLALNGSDEGYTPDDVVPRVIVSPTDPSVKSILKRPTQEKRYSDIQEAPEADDEPMIVRPIPTKPLESAPTMTAPPTTKVVTAPQPPKPQPPMKPPLKEKPLPPERPKPEVKTLQKAKEEPKPFLSSKEEVKVQKQQKEEQQASPAKSKGFTFFKSLRSSSSSSTEDVKGRKSPREKERKSPVSPTLSANSSYDSPDSFPASPVSKMSPTSKSPPTITITPDTARPKAPAYVHVAPGGPEPAVTSLESVSIMKPPDQKSSAAKEERTISTTQNLSSKEPAKPNFARNTSSPESVQETNIDDSFESEITSSKSDAEQPPEKKRSWFPKTKSSKPKSPEEPSKIAPKSKDSKVSDLQSKFEIQQLSNEPRRLRSPTGSSKQDESFLSDGSRSGRNQTESERSRSPASYSQDSRSRESDPDQSRDSFSSRSAERSRDSDRDHQRNARVPERKQYDESDRSFSDRGYDRHSPRDHDPDSDRASSHDHDRSSDRLSPRDRDPDRSFSRDRDEGSSRSGRDSERSFPVDDRSRSSGSSRDDRYASSEDDRRGGSRDRDSSREYERRGTRDYDRIDRGYDRSDREHDRRDTSYDRRDYDYPDGGSKRDYNGRDRDIDRRDINFDQRDSQRQKDREWDRREDPSYSRDNDNRQRGETDRSSLSKNTTMDSDVFRDSSARRPSDNYEDTTASRTSLSSGRTWQPKPRGSRGSDSSPPKRVTPSAENTRGSRPSLDSNGTSSDTNTPYRYRVAGSAFSASKPNAVSGLTTPPSGRHEVNSASSKSEASTGSAKSLRETTV